MGRASDGADHAREARSEGGDRAALAATAVFALVAAGALAIVLADRRPDPIFPDQFTHPEAPAVYVTARLPLRIDVSLPRPASALRMPVWIEAGRRPIRARVEEGARAPAEVTLARTGLARIPLAGVSERVRLTLSSDAQSREAAPRVLWARTEPTAPIRVAYAARPLDAVDVLPETGPLLIAEYPWPTRWLLGLWVPALACAGLAARRGTRAAAAACLVAVALAGAVSSALLWQRDYTRRAAHLDADQYAQSATFMARFLTRPPERAILGTWFRNHPHATTPLAPAALALPVAAGVPVAYAYALLAALASWLALLLVHRLAAGPLGVAAPLALAATLAFACHPMVLRSFARPITDSLGLALVLLTLVLLVRRIDARRTSDEWLLALVVLAHPLARPQGFGYWPFVAVALVLCDRSREGRWPAWRDASVSGLRVFLGPSIALLAAYAWLDWWHNVTLMLEKARRFRLDSTPRDFVASLVGTVQLAPALLLLGHREWAGRVAADPRLRLLGLWAVYGVALLVAARAPFWLRHFLPVVPVVYLLAAVWLDGARGNARRAGLALLGATALANVAVTGWQIANVEALPEPWAGLVSAP